MHSVLVIIKVTDAEKWETFLANLEPSIEQATGVYRPAENVWLLNLQKSVAPLEWLVSQAEKRGLPYGILQLADEPQWLPAGFDPTST